MSNTFNEFFPREKAYFSLPSRPSTDNLEEYTKYLQSLEKIIDKNFAIYQNNAAIDLNHSGEVNRRFREVLSKQMQEVVEAKGHYVTLSGGKLYKTERQKKIDRFNRLLPSLKRLTFTEQSSLPPVTHLYIFNDDEKVISLVKDYNISNEFQQGQVFDKDQLLLDLAQLEIGQWKQDYELPKSIMVTDGSSWDLTFEFAKNQKYRKLHYSGYMAWPYNFSELLDILKIQ